MVNSRFKSCHGCTRPEKKPGCHDHCKFYKEEKAANEADKERERKRRLQERAFREAEYKRLDKSTKYYNSKK